MTTYINPYTDFGFKHFSEEDAYENSLKYYRDYYNTIDSAVNSAVKIAVNIAVNDAINDTKQDAIVKALKRGKLSEEEIAEDNDVTVDLVLQIQRNIQS